MTYRTGTTGRAGPEADATGAGSALPGELGVRIEHLDGGSTVMVWLSGEIDLASAPALRDVFDLAFERGMNLVVDLADVRFINAAGISVLAAAAERARANGGSFAVRRMSPISRKVVHILRMEETLLEEAG